MNLNYNNNKYQDKEHMEKNLNVKVILIMNYMQLNYNNQIKKILILMKYKL